MKQIFRFFSLLLLATVTGTSAWAIDVPKPKTMPLTVGAEVYILNVGTGKYVGQGESWSTQSCVTDLGLKYIVKNAKDDGSAIRTDDDGNDITVLPEGQYWLYSPDINIDNRHTIDRWNDGTTGEGIKCCFSDQTDWDERGIWQVTEVAENTYMFTVPEGLTTYLDQQNEYVEGEAWGVQLDHASNSAVDGVTYGLYHDVVYADAPEMCQFQFIAAEDMAIYKAKVKLGKLAEDALALDIDVMVYEALIENPDATVEEIEAAIVEITEKLKAADSWNYPQDITEGIIQTPNPYQNNADGWQVFDGEGKELTASNIGTSSKHGEWWIGEFWSQAGYSIRQTIHVPKGVYTLRCYALTRDNMNAVLKAGENQMYIARFTSGQANNREGASKLFANGQGANDLSWVQLEEGDLEISLTADSEHSDYWMPWRNFELLDRGFNMRSFQNAAKELADGWEEEFMKDDEENPGEKVWRSPFTQSYYDAVASTVESIPTSTNTDEAYTIYVAVQKALNDLRANVNYYKFFFNRTDPEQPQYDNPWDPELFGGNLEFSDVWDEAARIFQDEDFTKTNEYLADLQERYLAARQNAIYEKIENADEGESVKGYITNPSFKSEDGTSASFEGWTVASSSTFQNNAGNIPVIEQWNGSNSTGVIDVYQEIAIRKVGAYRLTTKGWYRSTTNSETHEQEGYNTVNTYLYGASSEYKFHDIYEHPYTLEEKQQYFPKGNLYGPTADNAGATYNGPGADVTDEEYITELQDNGFEIVYPNNCTGANELFNNPDVNWYDMTCDFLGLGLDSPVKIGVRGRDIPGYAWLIWDDFDLIYLGSDLKVMQPIAQSAADDAKAEFYDEDGTLKNPMSAATKAVIDQNVAKIENPADVDELIAGYKAIDAAREAGRKSVANYKKVQNAVDKLDNEIIDSSDTATDEALKNAEDLRDELQDAIDKGTIADEDIDDVIARINKAINALYMPRDLNLASDENPIEMTKLIVNPKYMDDNNAASTEGWTAEGLNNVEVEDLTLGYAEGWGGTAESATFDIHQTITGMPEGTYKLMVNGLFRQGGVAADAKMSQYEYALAAEKLDLLEDKAKEDVQEYNAAGQFYGNGDYKPLHRWMFINSEEWEDAAADFNTSVNEYDYEFVDSLTIEGDKTYYYFPDNRASLYLRGLDGYYENELYCYVDNSGDLTIGACNKNATALDWTPFSNWRLYYLGTESSHESTTGIRETETKQTAVEAIYTVDGRLTNRLEKGLNIVKTRTADGKVVVKKVLVK